MRSEVPSSPEGRSKPPLARDLRLEDARPGARLRPRVSRGQVQGGRVGGLTSPVSTRSIMTDRDDLSLSGCRPPTSGGRIEAAVGPSSEPPGHQTHLTAAPLHARRKDAPNRFISSRTVRLWHASSMQHLGRRKPQPSERGFAWHMRKVGFPHQRRVRSSHRPDEASPGVPRCGAGGP
jgi:hypothetical protein